jgi:hypothetical protein
MHISCSARIYPSKLNECQRMVYINFVSLRNHAMSSYVTSYSLKILHKEASLTVSKSKGFWARKL